MNVIKNFREQLGLSQSELAAYLSIAKSQISMVELGLRELPTTALIKLAYFEQASLTVSKNTDTESIILTDHAAACIKKIEVLEKKLALLKNNFGQGMKLLQAVLKSKENLPSGKEGKKDKDWLEAQESIAQNKIQHNNTAAQKKIRIQIKALQLEAKLALENK